MFLRLLLPILLLAALLCGCTNGAIPPEPSTLAPTQAPTQAPTRPAIDTPEAFTSARENVLAAENWVLSYSMSTTWTMGEQSVTDAFEGTASIANRGSQEMAAIVTEELAYGSYRESFSNGMSYVRGGSSIFRGETTAQDFLDRQMPAVLLDASRYAQVEATLETDQCRFRFSEADSLEPWVSAPENAELLSASGEALLDDNGNLIQTGYEARFQVDGRECTVMATVKVTTPKSLLLDGLQQDQFDNCPKLSDIRVPRLMLQTVGKLFSATGFSAQVSETVHSEALTYTYSKNCGITLTGREDTLNALVRSESTVSDYRGQISNTRLWEEFADGLYSSWKEEGVHSFDSSVSAQSMRQYCEDAVLSGLLATKYLDDAVLTEENDSLTLTLTGGDAFVADIVHNLGTILQVDLDAQTEQIQTPVAQGYLVLDALTGLPVSMGLRFQRNHTVEGGTYALSYELTENIQFLP